MRGRDERQDFANDTKCFSHSAVKVDIMVSLQDRWTAVNPVGIRSQFPVGEWTTKERPFAGRQIGRLSTRRIRSWARPGEPWEYGEDYSLPTCPDMLSQELIPGIKKPVPRKDLAEFCRV